MSKFRLHTLAGVEIKGVSSITACGKTVDADKSGLLELSTAQAIELADHYSLIGQNGKELEEKGKEEKGKGK